jgi:hypothetical protein
MALRQCHGRELVRLGEKLSLLRQVSREEVLEDTTMRSVGHDGSCIGWDFKAQLELSWFALAFLTFAGKKKKKRKQKQKSKAKEMWREENQERQAGVAGFRFY